ncbi:hypothetical protein YC2023_064586 [Brassica napus]
MSKSNQQLIILIIIVTHESLNRPLATKRNLLGSRNTKRTNNLPGEFVRAHRKRVRISALQGQHGIHRMGEIHEIDCYKIGLDWR